MALKEKKMNGNLDQIIGQSIEYKYLDGFMKSYILYALLHKCAK